MELLITTTLTQAASDSTSIVFSLYFFHTILSDFARFFIFSYFHSSLLLHALGSGRRKDHGRHLEVPGPILEPFILDKHFLGNFPPIVGVKTIVGTSLVRPCFFHER